MQNTIIKDYQVKSELGQGGMATVYLAHDNKFDTNVAIKVLNKEYVHNDNIRKRFIAEARNMFKMSHPNIIKVTDLIDEGDTVAFVMEYIEGETLKEYLDHKGKLSDDEIKTIFSQMLEAVGYVHEQNLVHRDIKPSNFMITPKGQIKLLDFGIAKTTDVTSSEYTQTGTGIQMGTPLYMSPEQIKSTKDVTLKSDIYSLGVVLWQMVMGKKPYDTNTTSTFELQMKIVNEKLSLTNSPFDVIIGVATAKELNFRYKNCNDMKAKLENIGKQNFESTKAYTTKDSEKTIDYNREYINNVVYPEVIIGQQIWMSKNLDISHFRNGDSIPEAKTNAEWEKAGSNGEPAWCYYDNNYENGTIYGKLYNWHAVNDSRGLAPEGWLVPSNSDWTILIDYLGGELIAGSYMKKSNEWDRILDIRFDNKVINFSSLPSGYRKINGDFRDLGGWAGWWCSDKENTKDNVVHALSIGKSNIFKYYDNKITGLSIRCLRG